MTIVVPVRNVHQAVPWLLKQATIKEQTAVIVEVAKPEESLVFWPQFNLNPFLLFKASMDLIIKSGNPMVTQQFVLRDNQGALDCTVISHDGNGLIYTSIAMLQKAQAEIAGIPLGKLLIVVPSPTYEAGLKDFGKIDTSRIPKADPYSNGRVKPVLRLVGDKKADWLLAISEYMENRNVMGHTDWFVRRVAVPILEAWDMINSTDAQTDKKEVAKDILERTRSVAAQDWQFACDQYIVKWAGL